MSLFILLLACAPAYQDVPTKVVGVGYDPEEIGPSPTPYGGVVEYSRVNFAGGGLSLALMQLGSFDEVSPDMVGYAPPYAAVYGFSYIFTEKLAAADSLGGVTSVPPEAEDSCYTTFEATGPIGSFKTVDVGDYMELVTGDGTGGVRLDRYPPQYPSDSHNAFVYYNAIELPTSEAQYAYVPGDSNNPNKMEKEIFRRAAFPAGQDVEFRFPGGTLPEHTPLGSIPVPSGATNSDPVGVPNLPGGVQMEWSGPRFDRYGREQGESGNQRTCMAFAGDLVSDPQSAAECAAADSVAPGANGGAQVYTGPWDTDDGTMLLRWEPNESNSDEFVHVAVRFLGPVDEADPNYLEEVVSEDATISDSAKCKGADADTIQCQWAAAQDAGTIPTDATIPTGRRAPTACETDGEYVMDDAYLDHSGNFSPALHGDPFHNMAEVTCRMKDDGEFALTSAMLEDALTYARAHGAQGAVFYFGRSVEAEVDVPAAMDNYGNRRDISPVKIASRAIDIGRFWYEE